MAQRYRDTTSEATRATLEEYMSHPRLPDLRRRAAAPREPGGDGAERSLGEVVALPVSAALEFFGEVVRSCRSSRARSPAPILKEVRERLSFLLNVGLEYLTLGRSAETLSGGEAQRIRLATQIGSRLCGVLYILDEPSIGLHQRDNRRLLSSLQQLRDLGNTVLVVEHDEETIRAADHVVDLGPRAGRHGGEVVAEGTRGRPDAARRRSPAPTCAASSSIEIPAERRDAASRARAAIRGRARAQPAGSRRRASRSGSSWRSPGCRARARARW